MEKFERTIIVGASPVAVFNYLNDARSLVEIIPGAKDIEVLEHLSHGGYRFNWKRTLGGVRFEGMGECIVHAPHHQLTYLLEGGLHNTIDWSLQGINNGTALTMRVTYDIPAPLKMRHSAQSIREEYFNRVEHILGSIALSLTSAAPQPEKQVSP